PAPPLPPPSSLFPYTTLFRSVVAHVGGAQPGDLGGCTRVEWSDADPVQGPAVALLGLLVTGQLGGTQCIDDPLRIGLAGIAAERSEEHTSELQSRENLVCRLL